MSGNPIFEGWYADPEGVVFDDAYWIYPTYSDVYTKQLHLDAFSSPDLVNWTKHERILDTTIVPWVKQAMWAPSMIQKEDKYYLFFGGNDIQRPGRSTYDPDNDINHYGGIGVAVADAPGGPFKDHLGKPLIDDFYNDAQPIDQFVYKDTDGTFYIFYGGWGHCNVGRLNEDFTGIVPWRMEAYSRKSPLKTMLRGRSSSSGTGYIILCGPREAGEMTPTMWPMQWPMIFWVLTSV